MHIARPRYMNQLYSAINDGKTIILLHGGRGSGKTTLLKDLVSDHSLPQRKYYFSFEDDIVAKKFKNADDFIGYMQIKYGIDFQDYNLLLLNEIQYSKKLLTIFYELLSLDIKTQIIATGIVHRNDQEYKVLLDGGQVHTITVYPLDLFDFLEAKQIHTNYLSLDKPSPVMFKEIQHLFDEYLTRGGYPSVITATTADRKQQALKSIIQKVYDKDVGFVFNGDEILLFQELMQLFSRYTMQGYKCKPFAKELEISLPLLKKYTNFLLDNCLLYDISHFFEDKSRELSHQDVMAVSDTGIVSYMVNNFGSKLHEGRYIHNFIATEIVKHLSFGDQLMTYKKVNNSSIDFVIVHADSTLTPIIISQKNTTTIPKIYAGFFEHYGYRVRRYIKTTPLSLYKGEYQNKDFICIPHFMISKVMEIDRNL